MLQQLLIKPITTRVAGRSPAKGFILLFVAGLKANCYKLAIAIFTGLQMMRSEICVDPDNL